MITFFDFSVVEKISVDAVKHKFLTMKVDHMNGVVSFSILDLESDTVKNHLTALAVSLNKARSMIYPPLNKASKIEDTLPGLAKLVEKEHKKLLARKTIIEQRNEEQERQLLEKEREEESKRLQLQKSNVEAEQKRLASELEKRKIQRIQKEIEEREIEEAKSLPQEKFSKNKKKPLIEWDKLTKQALMELALNEQLREKQEMEKKLQKLNKQMDYLERANREEAAQLIESTSVHVRNLLWCSLFGFLVPTFW
ncbi:hypothetical protein SOVF_067220 [Spinacia oleracea]|nr:hypothetical protein SOVF_067220 [Spinacia oleracea]